MPVRRIETSGTAANPFRPTASVTTYFTSTVPKEMPQGLSPRLQGSLAEAKMDVGETKINFAHRTCITGALNDRHENASVISGGTSSFSRAGAGAGAGSLRAKEEAAALLASQTSLRGLEKTYTSAALSKLKGCGTLTTSRIAYTDVLLGASEAADVPTRVSMRGVSTKPSQKQPSEAPYGMECAFVIGGKTSAYRDEFCATAAMQRTIGAGHAPAGPSLMSVNTPLYSHPTATSPSSSSSNNNNKNNNNAAAAVGTYVSNANQSRIPPAPPSQPHPPSSSRRQQQQQHPEAALGYNLYVGSDVAGSEKVERAVDAQTRREVSMLRSSVRRVTEGTEQKRSELAEILTPRSQKLKEMLARSGSAHHNNGRAPLGSSFSSSSSSSPRPAPLSHAALSFFNGGGNGAPSSYTYTAADTPLFGAAGAGAATPTSCAALGSSSPRRVIINKNTLDKVVPPSPSYMAETAGTGTAKVQEEAYRYGTTKRTIPVDVVPPGYK